ncbi:MAG: hypothetical protein JWQ09_3672 [Segetibacter sp.]|nr:hypothetical protein [Segetibacter sp.]
MGLIKELDNVNFYVIDKPWTDEERKEFSEFIKQRKEQLKKSGQHKPGLKLKSKKKSVEQNQSPE